MSPSASRRDGPAGTLPPPALEVRSLVARHGALTVLHGIDLEVAAGEVVAVLGPNGAGKTTLVRCVAGLHADMEGTITVGGDRLRRGDALARRSAGLVSVGDRRDLIAALPVERYLGLILDADQIPRAYEIFPPLAALAGRRCGLLSGGEAQMLALARVLAARPRVVVIDEISQGLAPIVLRELLPAVRRAADAGAAVLLVEQFAHAASEVADRVVVLDQGTVVYAGPVRGAPLEETYLIRGAAAGPAPTDVLTDVTVGLRPAQRRALAGRAAAEGLRPGEIIRSALDAYLGAPEPSRRGRPRRRRSAAGGSPPLRGGAG